MREMRSELGGGLTCYECLHVWPTEDALISDHNALIAELATVFDDDEPIPLASTVDDIYSCPLCMHDF